MASQRKGSRAHSISDEAPVSPSSSKHKQKHQHKHKHKPAPQPPPQQSSSPSYIVQPAVRSTPTAYECKHLPTSATSATFPARHGADRFPREQQQQQQQDGNYRDSIASIVEDPFFQQYDDSRGELHGPPTPSVPDAGDWLPPRVESLTTRTTTTATTTTTTTQTTSSSTTRVAARSPTRMDTINICVLGADGVGKSSLIQRALRLPRPPSAALTSVRIDIDGVPLLVTLVEFDLEWFDLETDQPMRWPRQVNGQLMPRIDGALVLYDVMNKDSIRDFPPSMAALANAAIPTVLVATKCDNPETLWQINADGMAGVFPSVTAGFKTSANVPGSTRDCVQCVIRAAIASRRAIASSGAAAASAAAGGDAKSDPAAISASSKSSSSNSRRRAASSAAHLEAPEAKNNGRPLSQHSKHSRASSDLSLLRGVPPPNASSASNDGYPPPRNPSRSPRIDFNPGSPHLGLGLGPGVVGGAANSPDMADDNGPMSVSSMLRTHGGVRLDSIGHPPGAPDTFLDVDESGSDSFRNSEEVPILQRGDDYLDNRPSRQAGLEFDDLVDRLIAPRMSRADNNFADIFLCLYRQFAAPSTLFRSLVARLEQARGDRTSTAYLTQIATQLRVIEVIAKWVSLYPGDFARLATRRQLEDLIAHLSSEPIFIAASQQLRWYLEHTVVVDDDTGWSTSDEPDQTPAELQGRTQSQSHSLRSAAAGFSDSMSSLHLEETGGTGISGGTGGTGHTGSSGSAAYYHPGHQRPSGDTEGSSGHTGWGAPPHGRGGVASGTSSVGRAGGSTAQFQFHSLEDYEMEAATMVPNPMLPLNKIRYHIFLDKDTDDIADEITRIDWVMFSSIRVRDLVRHVSLGADERERCRGLENVYRMIHHFNHVAAWVANTVLIRDKAKHRAPVLEKFMLIALRLRVLNNYNGLAAVLAGINGSAVHRLAQTKALVSPEVQKRFARLVLLMGTQKSHFAYRLAWENSPLPRIPFMPLHRRDLVSAEEGSKTRVGPEEARINWRKFEVLGEVILPLMKSQGTPYPNLRKDDGSRELILDCKMPTDEEEIYQRSVQVEPTSGAGESSRRRFPWLAG